MTRVIELLQGYSNIWLGRLGKIETTQHRMDLKKDARPTAVPPHRAGRRQRQLIRMGVIEPAQSEWASLVLFNLKADGSLRFFIDYRRLNNVTIKDSYPFQRMN